MGNVIKSLFGGSDNSSNAAEIAAQQSAQSQRQALATLANEQAQVDQAAASTTSRANKGRRLLTAIGAPGVATLGG